MPATHIFFLSDDGAIEPIAQHDYADVVTGKCRMPRYALRRIRVADWYAGEGADEPVVLNETYSVLYFDESGSARPSADPALIRENKSLHVGMGTDPYDQERRSADETWTPTRSEREAMLRACV